MFYALLQNLLNLGNSKESIVHVLVSEKCCGLYSMKTGTLIMTLVSLLFGTSILVIEQVFEIQTLQNETILELHKFVIVNPKNDSPDQIHANSKWDVYFPGIHCHYLPLWVIIFAGVLVVISIMGLLSVALEWSLFLLPYSVYRSCWFLSCFIIFFPFFAVEFLILIILSIFPTFPSFLVIFTWIIKFLEGIVVAVLAVEIVIVVFQFHLASIVLGCYQNFKSKRRASDRTGYADVSEASDNSMHEVIETERTKSYQSMLLHRS